MEGRKQQSGSSSFTTDLFGSKDSPASSPTGIFGSIFAPSTKVLGRESVRSESFEKKQGPASPAWNAKTGHAENISQAGVGENHSAPSREMGSYYQEEKLQPCHLSSSIYYGGQDVYSFPQSTQSSVPTTSRGSRVQFLLPWQFHQMMEAKAISKNTFPGNFSKDNGEDDSGCASRGNWWQGSLYY